MISRKALHEYEKAFDTPIYYAEPSDVLVVEDNAGRVYAVAEATDGEFIGLIEKSRERGANLFLDKGRLFDPYPKGAVY